MFMTNYVEKNMNMVMHMGNVNMIARSNYSQMATSGFGDSTALVMIRASDAWTISYGISLPTGSIDEEVVMNGSLVQAPYNMQLGSGTVDILQSVTYKGGDTGFNWGVQESFTYRTAANSNGYVLGNKFEFNGWVRKSFADRLAISTRLNIFDQEPIEGRDVNIANSKMAPTFDAANSGRHQAELSFGISKRFQGGNRIGFEYTKPIAQAVNGIQLKNQYAYTFSWSYMM